MKPQRWYACKHSIPYVIFFTPNYPMGKPAGLSASRCRGLLKEGSGVIVLIDHKESESEILEQIAMFPEKPKPLPRSVSEEGQQVYRVIGTGSQILRDLNVEKMRLLSPPTKFNALSGFHLEIVEFVE